MCISWEFLAGPMGHFGPSTDMMHKRTVFRHVGPFPSIPCVIPTLDRGPTSLAGHYSDSYRYVPDL